MKFCLLFLIASLAGSANASRECDWAVQVGKDERYRIDARNAQIGQIKNQITTDQNTLNKELIPLMEANAHTMSVYQRQSQAMQDSFVAVQQAIAIVEQTLVSNKGIKKLVEQLKAHSPLSADRSLADQIRDVLSKARLRPDAKDQLEQLANAVALIESNQPAWQSSESILLQSYLNGKSSLVDGLMQKLSELNEKLNSDLTDLQANDRQDQLKADEAAKNVSDMQKKISDELTKIDGLQKDNVNSANAMKTWDPGKYCPKVDPHDFTMHHVY